MHLKLLLYDLSVLSFVFYFVDVRRDIVVLGELLLLFIYVYVGVHMDHECICSVFFCFVSYYQLLFRFGVLMAFDVLDGYIGGGELLLYIICFG